MKTNPSYFILHFSFFFFLGSILLPSPLAASETRILIEKGNQAYNTGMYARAAEHYNKVILLGYESAELYYNIGNTCFKLNDIPGAILWYERARRLDPGNEDIDYNLKVANSKISDKIEPLPELFYIRWYNALVNTLSTDTWARGTIILFIISLILGGIYMTSRVLILRKTGFWSGLTTLTLSLLFLVMTWSSHRLLQTSSEAVIFTPVVTVKSSPDEKAVDLFVLHEGTKVSLKDHIGDWYEIRIANGSVGWVPVSALQKI